MSESEREERIFDEYLAAAQRGEIEAVDAFCAARGGASPELLDRLRALRWMLAEEGHTASAAGDPDGEPDEPTDEDLPFERLGSFRLLRRLGEGGMGVVFLAEQEPLRRRVALKLIRPERSGSRGAERQFEREAQAIARLAHPNVATLFATGEERGVRYLAMEYVPGSTLEHVLRETVRQGRPAPLQQSLRWIAQIGRALECAHRAGVIHRDVKPANIRITPDGVAKLVDFGLARKTDLSGTTVTVGFQGSPFYASPEQVEGSGAEIGHASDIYSLGATLYECATGRVPFEAETNAQLFRKILLREPDPPRRWNPSIPRDLQTAILKAIEKDPRHRYATAGDFAADLEAILDLRPISARPTGALRRATKWVRRNRSAAALAAGGVLLLGAALGLEAWRSVEARRSSVADARAAVGEARTALAAFRQSRRDAEPLARAVEQTEWDVQQMFVPRLEIAQLEKRVEELHALRRMHELLGSQIQELILRAERLDPGAEGIGEVRAEYYVERWREAVSERDAVAAAFFRGLAVESDPAGTLRGEIGTTGAVSIQGTPHDAEVHAFSFREVAELVEGGAHRLVPVPVSGPPPIEPGRWALRVIRGAGELRTGDHVVEILGAPIEGTVFAVRSDGSEPPARLIEIDGQPVHELFDVESHAPGPAVSLVLERDGVRTTHAGTSLESLGWTFLDPRGLAERGGVPARALRADRPVDLLLPAGLVVRTTAAPVVLGASSLQGIAPTTRSFEPEFLLIVLRRDGFEDQRWTLHVSEAREQELIYALAPAGTTPTGLVYITERDYWMMDREVTFLEYLEFLNDPATLTEVDRADQPTRWPRSPSGTLLVVRETDGTFALAPGVVPEMPVAGVSWNDAKAYATWLDAREAARGSDLAYALPTYTDWCGAAAGGKRRFVYGNHYRPHWIKSCFARPRPVPEPILRFPIDESASGLFDLSGGVSEWCDGWFWEENHDHPWAGGSWVEGETKVFSNCHSEGLPADSTSKALGFRLAARRRAPENRAPPASGGR